MKARFILKRYRNNDTVDRLKLEERNESQAMRRFAHTAENIYFFNIGQKARVFDRLELHRIFPDGTTSLVSLHYFPEVEVSLVDRARADA